MLIVKLPEVALLRSDVIEEAFLPQCLVDDLQCLGSEPGHLRPSGTDFSPNYPSQAIVLSRKGLASPLKSDDLCFLRVVEPLKLGPVVHEAPHFSL
jgi:hypothetical protein